MKMKLWVNILIVCMGLSFVTAVSAKGRVYLQNNTAYAFMLSTSQTGDSNLSKGNKWDQVSSSLRPWEKQKEFLWYNRNEGITNGDDFYFNTDISAEGNTLVTLQQKLHGTWRFSNIYHSAENSTFDHSWYQGYTIRSQNFSFNGKDFTIKYKAKYNAGTASDDIYYVIHEVEPYQLPYSTASNQLNVLAYNIYTILTQTKSSIDDRVGNLPAVLHNNDVIVFSEAFNNSARSDLKKSMASEYPYNTKVVDKSGALEDGGVFIMSKWPITAEHQTVYNDCNAEDCLSPKGVMYARIDKNGQNYHIFGSHTQAWANDKAQAARALQFQQLRSFIDSRNIPADEAVIVAGDLNVDKLHYSSEYELMLQILNASEPEKADYGHDVTADDVTNNLAGDGQEYLDYVLYLNDHLQPITATNGALVRKSIANNVFGSWEYSDHYPVLGVFSF